MKRENNEKFETTKVLYEGRAELFELQIDSRNECARYRATMHWSTRGKTVTKGRWQKIRFNRAGEAYIMYHGRRLFFHKFYR